MNYNKARQVSALGERVVSGADESDRDARARIIRATVTVMADRGLAGLSYRQVASRAKVSLALVNYYYPSKFGLVAAASSAILERYTDAFARAASRFRSGAPPSFRDFAYRLVGNATDRDRTLTLAWAEISLDAVRHEESLSLAQAWNVSISKLWSDIAEATGEPNPHRIARSGIDLVMGLLFFVTALRLDQEQVDQVLNHEGQPTDLWPPSTCSAPSKPPAATNKAQRTRNLILGAAIDLLISEGAAEVSFRTVAEKAGLTATAPAYHFRTTDALLASAGMLLVENSKQRYRGVMQSLDRQAVTFENLVEVTTTIFIREATEFSALNLAFFSTWIEASRRPELRQTIWGFVRDIYRGWQTVFELAAKRSLPPVTGILGFALFVGKLVRILSTGSKTMDLASIRREFTEDFHKLCFESFWDPDANRTRS